MAFKAVFIAHAPDADASRHRSLIDTGKYRLHASVVRSQAEALQVCRELREKEGIESVLLCPGFSHRDVAEIFASLDGRVAVCVATAPAAPSSRRSCSASTKAAEAA